jgi:NAD(P)H-nitrite reductase large subunit
MQRHVTNATYDYVVLGAGVAGVSAVEALRQGDRSARIALVGDEPYLMYYRPRLPGYVAGHLARASIVERDSTWAERRRVDALLGVDAIGVESHSRLVTLADGRRLRYRSLLLASGAEPRRLGIAGDGADGVETLWRLADADAMRARLPEVRRAVTIGGGLIGAELTEALCVRGVDVTHLCREPWWYFPYLDETGGRLVEAELRAHGVKARFGAEAAAIENRDDRVCAVQTRTGERLPADLVTYSLGPVPRLGYLAGSGIAVGAHGVLVDEWLRTSVDGVWAAGAVADVQNPVAGRRVNQHNVPAATLQGRMAALGMLGRPEQLLRVPQTGFRLFGLSLTFVGVLDCTDPSLESLVCDRSPRSYARIFLREGRIAGGVLINSTHAGEVRRLVEEHAPAPADSTRFLERLTA